MNSLDPLMTFTVPIKPHNTQTLTSLRWNSIKYSKKSISGNMFLSFLTSIHLSKFSQLRKYGKISGVKCRIFSAFIILKQWNIVRRLISITPELNYKVAHGFLQFQLNLIASIIWVCHQNSIKFFICCFFSLSF